MLIEAIESTYDKAMVSYYESEEFKVLDSVANDNYERLLTALPDSLQKELAAYKESMMSLLASEACNAYTKGVLIGLSEKI
ncbi:hypothetical protein D6855_16050 [Butyrivibrio sp. CB08]|uniref:hypothetical protein n=1 Tax=Butyrivibrio sp. CB08 TaxID=2364879 RepID=UPI000EA9E647|nr:hypothetical protein [Butyrivibrio sp. CB08]RKM55444.1 hypothetical protein D6855_16050 [Butyrivibrio sp. CB08]